MEGPHAVGRHVIGFDRNDMAIALAKDLYPLPILKKDIQDEPFYGFDALVCLETFEHLERPWDFLDQLSATVRELVLSVPIIPTKHFNEFHLHDFTFDQVKEGLEKRGWKVEATAYQDEENLTHPTYTLFYATR